MPESSLTTGSTDANAADTRAQGHPEPDPNLAMIGNCALSALIDGRGRIVWCCMPRFDGGAVLHALLGASSEGAADGHFSTETTGSPRCRVMPA